MRYNALHWHARDRVLQRNRPRLTERLLPSGSRTNIHSVACLFTPRHRRGKVSSVKCARGAPTALMQSDSKSPRANAARPWPFIRPGSAMIAVAPPLRTCQPT
eukprot:scaffold2367_cov58-Phaeocystis_antarctica.AAC.8